METTDQIMQEDLEQFAKEEILEQFRDQSVLVTGATGLIGSQIVKGLLCANRLKGLNITVYAMVRNEEKAKRVFAQNLDQANLKFVCQDICQKIQMEGKVDYILHLASATSSKYFVEHPVETIYTAIDGSRNILEFAKEQQVKGVVYLSSLEVYGVTDPTLPTVKEDQYGYIDILNVRSSYSEGKQMVENLCASFAKEYGVPVKVARLGQTFGPGVEYGDKRVFAEFARSVIEKKDIVLHTEGKTKRNYCYVKDAVTALFYILAKGENGQAYNVVNEETDITIRDMAQMLADEFPEAGIQVRVEIEDAAKFGYNPDVIIKLDTARLRSLGWQPTVDLKGMFARMIESMKNNR